MSMHMSIHLCTQDLLLGEDSRRGSAARKFSFQASVCHASTHTPRAHARVTSLQAAAQHKLDHDKDGKVLLTKTSNYF